MTIKMHEMDLFDFYHILATFNEQLGNGINDSPTLILFLYDEIIG